MKRLALVLISAVIMMVLPRVAFAQQAGTDSLAHYWSRVDSSFVDSLIASLKLEGKVKFPKIDEFWECGANGLTIFVFLGEKSCLVYSQFFYEDEGAGLVEILEVHDEGKQFRHRILQIMIQIADVGFALLIEQPEQTTIPLQLMKLFAHVPSQHKSIVLLKRVGTSFKAGIFSKDKKI